MYEMFLDLVDPEQRLHPNKTSFDFQPWYYNTKSSMLDRHICLLLEDFLDRWTSQQTFHPLVISRIFACNVEFLSSHDPRDHIIPRDEGKVCVGDFVTHQRFLTGKPRVQDTNDASDFVSVPLNGAGDLFRVEEGEPRCLSVVRALSGDLEAQPLNLDVLLGSFAVADFVIFVVLVHKVLDNSTRFPERNTSVRVVYGRDASIGIDFHVWLRFGQPFLFAKTKFAEKIEGLEGLEGLEASRDLSIV